MDSILWNQIFPTWLLSTLENLNIHLSYPCNPISIHLSKLFSFIQFYQTFIQVKQYITMKKTFRRIIRESDVHQKVNA